MVADGTSRSSLGQPAKASVLELEYSNAQERFRDQRDTFREFGREGIQMLRLFLLFVGAPAAILGTLEPSALANLTESVLNGGCALSAYPAGCFASTAEVAAFTFGSLVLTALLNVLPAGFEAAGVRNQSNPLDIQAVLESEETVQEFYRRKLADYKGRIEENDRVIHGMEALLGLGKAFVFFTLLGLATLSYAIFTRSPLWMITWIAASVVIYVPLRVLPKPYRQAGDLRLWRYYPVYDGEDKKRDN